MRLGPAGDLFRFRDPAADAQIDARVVDQVFFNELAKLPLAAELLAGREWHVDVLAEQAEAIGALAADRIFHEEGAIRLDGTAKLDGIGRVETSMDIEADLDALAERGAHGLEHADRFANGLGRLEAAAFADIGREAHELPAFVTRCQAALD